MAKTSGKKPSGGKVRAAVAPGRAAATGRQKAKSVAPSIKAAPVAKITAPKITAPKIIAPKIAVPKIMAKAPATAVKAPKTAPNGNPVLARRVEKNKETKPPMPPSAPVVPAAAASSPPSDNGKPRKNAAGFNARDLDHFRELLLSKRRELLGDLRSMEHEALYGGGNGNLSNLPIHMADLGTDNYEQEFTLGLVEKDRQVLREINTALLKIQAGTFGICEGTSKPINRERLEYQPWARFSIEHARRLERGGRPGRP